MSTLQEKLVGRITIGLFRLITFLPGAEVRNAVNLRSIPQVIIVSNHVSNLDPFYLKWAVEKYYPQFNMYGLAKKELFGNRVIQWWMEGMQTILVDRDKPALTTIRTIRSRLLEGISIALFPQGTRNGISIMQGAHDFAYRNDIPILPVTLTYSRRLGHYIVIQFHPVLYKRDYQNAEGLEVILRGYWKL